MPEFPYFQNERDRVVWQMTVGSGETEGNNQVIIDLLSVSARGLAEVITRGLEEAGKKPEPILISRLTEEYIKEIEEHELP